MGHNDTMCCDSGQLERVRYFSRQLITAGDLTLDQDYHRERQRLHNRMLHGWGIVCGLEMQPEPTKEAPLNVCISPGYALSGFGDDIYVQSCISLDLAKYITDPAAGNCRRGCGSAIASLVDPEKPFYVALKYVECSASPVRVSPIGCGCDDTACEYSRIRDSFEVACLASLPASHAPVDPEDKPSIATICTAIANKVLPCPAPCKDPWIVLGQVTLSAGIVKSIDTQDRRILLSTAMLQEMIVLNACPID